MKKKDYIILYDYLKSIWINMALFSVGFSSILHIIIGLIQNISMLEILIACIITSLFMFVWVIFAVSIIYIIRNSIIEICKLLKNNKAKKTSRR